MLQPLAGVRILSLALNLPGPAALARCRSMGAECTKLEPLARPGQPSADPLGIYCPNAYAQLHAGIRVLQADLKTPAGQQTLQAELARMDVLLTSFRPTALAKLGLTWEALQARFPRLSLVRIVGSADADQPGHDLTYQAQAGLLPGTEMPATLFADMGGALLASEAVLQVMLARAHNGQGQRLDIALADAAQWLALPRHWGLTLPAGNVGGAHAGYRIYPCQDGRVALAALEPHFAAALFALLALPPDTDPHAPHTHAALALWLQSKTRDDLNALAQQHDIPLWTMG